MELIMVMVLFGILSAVALGRFTSQTEFDARGFFDQTSLMVRYAKNLAIAQRRNVFVQVDQPSGFICLTYVALDAQCALGGAPSNPVLHPADQQWYRKKTPKNVDFSASTNFSFSALGRPNPNSDQTITITGGGSITIEGETGYVH